MSITAYRQNATIPSVAVNDENWAQRGLVYDGRTGTDAAVRNFGSANINLQPFFEADQVQITAYAEDYPTYYFTDILAWYVQLIPHVEITLQQNFVQVGGEAADRKTFKSNANHNFGIVYSDFYGRQSTVYPLGSAFVPPYDMQPGAEGGAVMKVSINNAPPSWVYSYQIV